MGIQKGKRNGRVTSARVAAMVAAFLGLPGGVAAFNRIHSASYDLEPAGNHPQRAYLSVAGIVDARNTDVWGVPVSLALRASPQVEFGGGIQTAWGSGVGDHVSYLVFGVKWQARTRTSFQADLLVPADADNGKGFSLASHHRFHHAAILDSRLALRVGFMEALADRDAVAAFEAGWYPMLMPQGPLGFEFGMIGSSQTRDFEGHLAMDLQPALVANFRRNSSLRTAVALGLAGDDKEKMRIKVQFDHGF